MSANSSAKTQRSATDRRADRLRRDQQYARRHAMAIFRHCLFDRAHLKSAITMELPVMTRLAWYYQRDPQIVGRIQSAFPRKVIGQQAGTRTVAEWNIRLAVAVVINLIEEIVGTKPHFRSFSNSQWIFVGGDLRDYEHTAPLEAFEKCMPDEEDDLYIDLYVRSDGTAVRGVCGRGSLERIVDGYIDDAETVKGNLREAWRRGRQLGLVR